MFLTILLLFLKQNASHFSQKIDRFDLIAGKHSKIASSESRRQTIFDQS